MTENKIDLENLANSIVFIFFTKGIISFEEFKKIEAKNKTSFSENKS